MTFAQRWIVVVGWGLAALYLAAMIFLISIGASRDAALPPATDQDQTYFVGETADWLLDFGTIGTIDAQTLPDIMARMQPNAGKMPGVGLRYYDGGKLWLRFTVPALAGDQREWVIRLNQTRVREAHMAVIRDGTIRNFDWIYNSPDRRAQLDGRMPAFAFDRQEIEGATVLLGFNSLGAMRGTVTVETQRAYEAYEMRQAIMFGLLEGILLALALYLLVIGTRLGERSLLFAAGLSFFAGAFIFGAGGYIHSYALPGWQTLSDVLLYGTQPVMMTFWVLLAVSYLDLPRRAPWLAATCVTIALILPFQGVLTLLTGLGFKVPFITDNATPVLIGIVVGLLPVIWYSIRGDRRAWRFLACFAPVAIFSFIRAINYLTPSPNLAFVGFFDTYLDIVLTMALLAILVVVDIQVREATLRRQATQNEQRFRTFAEIASDSYFETDSSGLIVGAAGRMTRDFGLVEGANLATVLAQRVEGNTEAVVEQFRQALLRGEGLRDVEVAARGADGQPGWLSFNLVPWQGTEDGGMGLRGTLSEVTERVERRQREARQNTLSALGQLASGVAHEVNNLLHPMVNLAQRVRDKHTADDEAKKLLDLVVASGKHAGEIVAGVLNSFNPTRAPGERLAIEDALSDALKTVQATVPATIDLRQTIAEGTGITVPPGEMLQVVSNLLSNAIRAMDGAGRLEVALSRRPQGGAVLTFKDNGPGMPENIRRRAAEPFVTGRAEGTGLGLSVVANIVRNWHGDLDIRSAPGEGTEILITLANAPAETAKP